MNSYYDHMLFIYLQNNDIFVLCWTLYIQTNKCKGICTDSNKDIGTVKAQKIYIHAFTISILESCLHIFGTSTVLINLLLIVLYPIPSRLITIEMYE